MEYSLDRKLFVEFVGTFLFVFAIGMVTEKTTGAGALAPLAIGSVLMILVFAGGHVSGAHYNPAVSTAVLVRRKLAASEYAGYVVVQLIAALLGALLVKGIGGKQSHAMVASNGKMLVVEFLWTFTLAYVVLNVATARATQGNSFYGLAIGFTVVAGAFAFGGISGGAFNPAVAFGATIFGAFPWSHIWIYFVANLLGGSVAAGVFLYLQEPAERIQEHVTRA